MQSREIHVGENDIEYSYCWLVLWL